MLLHIKKSYDTINLLKHYASCNFQEPFEVIFEIAIYKFSFQFCRIIFILTSVTFANAGAAMKTT